MYGRKSLYGRKEQVNPNASYFQSPFWIGLVGFFAVMTLTFVMIGIVTGEAGE